MHFIEMAIKRIIMMQVMHFYYDAYSARQYDACYALDYDAHIIMMTSMHVIRMFTMNVIMMLVIQLIMITRANTDNAMNLALQSTLDNCLLEMNRTCHLHIGPQGS